LEDTVIIDGVTPSCAGCSFDVAKIATLGSRTDAEIPQRVPEILRDSRGFHYLVFHGWVNKPILRYDSTGRFLGKLGAFGQGPGEYEMTFAAFFGAADSLYVWAEGRLQAFGPDGGYGRSLRVPRYISFGLGPASDQTAYSWRRGRHYRAGADSAREQRTFVVRFLRHTGFPTRFQSSHRTGMCGPTFCQAGGAIGSSGTPGTDASSNCSAS
jgi:hypothetical protein